MKQVKKLKEAGWNKPTHFKYEVYVRDGKELFGYDADIHTIYFWDQIKPKNLISAPTLQEILVELPLDVALFKTPTGYIIELKNDVISLQVINESAVEATAELWIKLNEK